MSACVHMRVFVCMLEKKKEKRVFSNYLVVSSVHVVSLYSLVQKSLGKMR